MNEALISLGSNIDKERNLPRAIVELGRQSSLHVLSISAVLQTPASGEDGQVAAQPEYHNAAMRLSTELSPLELRALLRALEARLGRVRSGDKYAPRPIDLDLAGYGDPVLACTTGAIEQPLDADVLRHAHVAVPLAEVAPDWVHPQTGATLAAIAATFAAPA